MWSLNYQQFELLSLSVAEILVEEKALVAPFLFNTTRFSVHKNSRKLIGIQISVRTKISAILAYFFQKLPTLLSQFLTLFEAPFWVYTLLDYHVIYSPHKPHGEKLGSKKTLFLILV